MFCTNCGNKLPEGARFCPNCGARVIMPVETAATAPFPSPVTATEQPAAQLAEEAAETTTEAVETTEEMVAETAEAVQEAAADFTKEAAETVAEAVEAAEETVEEAALTVGEPAEEVKEAAEDFTDAAEELSEEAAETAETVKDTAEETAEELTESVMEAPEAADEAVDAVWKEAEETAEETALTVGEAAEEVKEAAAEFAEDIEETAEAAEEDIAQAAEVAEDNAAEVAAEAAVFTEPVFRTAEETAAAPETVPAGAAADAAEETLPQSPYTAGTAAAAAQKAKPEKKKNKVLRALIAILLLAALAVGGYYLYQNLPAQKFKRYKQEAMIALSAEDYTEATAQFRKALEIEPADEECLSALLMMFDTCKGRSREALTAGDYEKALSEIKKAYEIYPEKDETKEEDLEEIYFNWSSDLAYGGKEAEADRVFAMAQEDGLSEDRIERIASGIARGKAVYRIESEIESLTDAVISANSNSDYALVFSTLAGQVANMNTYENELGASLPFRYTGSDGKTMVIWRYSASKKAAQVYIGQVNADGTENGHGEVYYISKTDSEKKGYEFFSSEWKNGVPQGSFTEIDFTEEPGEPTDDNSVLITGSVADGHYNGDVDERLNGVIFHFKFNKGKMTVLDTVDPNGNENNVVAYNDDKTRWLTRSNESLSGTFGLRFLKD